jgi:hypothetical protein
MIMSYESDIEANALLVSLTEGVSFEVPNVDLTGSEFAVPGDVTAAMYALLTKLTNADLTTGVDGTGTFDVLMKSFAAHLKVEYNANRITGAEYTKAFIALTESAMGGAVQFLLGRDQAFWQAQTAQIAAITARIGLESAKVQHAALQFQALTAEVDYALTKLKLATEDAQYGTLKYQLDNLMPAQLTLLREQVEAQRAQTLDTRVDGVPVSGTLGKQRELYNQQITSYQRDSEAKAAKMFVDAWITQKTIDEGLLPPNGFTNASLDEVLTVLKTNNNLG